MKKITTLVLGLVMAFSLTACGGKESIKETEKQETDTALTAAPTASSESEAANDESDFSEVIVVDNEECKITLTGVEEDEFWGYTINALLENKSSDKTYMFSVDKMAVNGVKCNPFFASEVAAGKKSNEGISFGEEELKENGITKYTDIELTFRVYDSNDWSADEVANETVHIYPFGESNAEQYVREPQSSDNIIVENENVTVIVTGYETDEIWGYTAKLFLINHTDKNVMFSADEVSVNGFMADPFYAISVPSGKCAFSTMSWSDTTFEENGITQVDTIEFILRVYDEDNWSAGDLAKESIKLNP